MNSVRNKPVRLTIPQIIDALREDGKYPDPYAFQRLFPLLEADARLIEKAVLEANGLLVKEN